MDECKKGQNGDESTKGWERGKKERKGRRCIIQDKSKKEYLSRLDYAERQKRRKDRLVNGSKPEKDRK